MAELDELIRPLVAEWIEEPFSQAEDDAQILTDRIMAVVRPILEDRDRLRAIGQRITTTLQEGHWVVVDELRAALEGREPT